jgi:hypothetical protein
MHYRKRPFGQLDYRLTQYKKITHGCLMQPWDFFIPFLPPRGVHG